MLCSIPRLFVYLRYFKTILRECLRAGLPLGFPSTAPPPVCVSTVLGMLAVWIPNPKKTLLLFVRPVPGRVLSVMQFGAMCCTVSVMQFVALCCTVFQSQDIPKVSSRHQKNTSERRSERGTEKGLCGGAGSEKKWVRDS